jgi:hypothetical protein
VLVVNLSGVAAVTCETCKDTIVGCKGGADCALLKDPKANAATLSDPKSVASLTVTNLLPPDLLCTFTRAVMESLAAVARAPVGGGAADISVCVDS